MGMDATIWVDGVKVESYKCINAYKEIRGPIDDSNASISVRYRYDEEYGDHYLHVYARDVDTGFVHEFLVTEKCCGGGGSDDDDADNDDLERPFVISLPLETYGHDVELYVCIKGDYYENMGPTFDTAPNSEWYVDTLEARNIRSKGLSFLREIVDHARRDTKKKTTTTETLKADDDDDDDDVVVSTVVNNDFLRNIVNDVRETIARETKKETDALSRIWKFFEAHAYVENNEKCLKIPTPIKYHDDDDDDDDFGKKGTSTTFDMTRDDAIAMSELFDSFLEIYYDKNHSFGIVSLSRRFIDDWKDCYSIRGEEDDDDSDDDDSDYVSSKKNNDNVCVY